MSASGHPHDKKIRRVAKLADIRPSRAAHIRAHTAPCPPHLHAGDDRRTQAERASEAETAATATRANAISKLALLMARIGTPSGAFSGGASSEGMGARSVPPGT